MARPALSAARSLDVLNFMAAHPDESFTLSELVRRVGVNVSSLHAILAVLEQRGVVLRDPDKSYSLGPMLVTLGQAALRRNGLIDGAVHTVERLSAELGVTGLVVAAAGDEMSVLHEVVAGRRSASRLGQRIRMTPPVGGVFYAWAEPEAVEAWIATAPKGVRQEADEIHRWLSSVRDRGYAVGLETPARRELRRAVRALSEEPSSRSARGRLRSNVARLGDLATVVIETSPDDAYDVAHVAAPVRAFGGGTAVSLYLLGFRRHLSAYELEWIGDRLRDAADGVGAASASAAGADPSAAADEPGVAALSTGSIW